MAWDPASFTSLMLLGVDPARCRGCRGLHRASWLAGPCDARPRSLVGAPRTRPDSRVSQGRPRGRGRTNRLAGRCRPPRASTSRAKRCPCTSRSRSSTSLGPGAELTPFGDITGWCSRSPSPAGGGPCLDLSHAEARRVHSPSRGARARDPRTSRRRRALRARARRCEPSRRCSPDPALRSRPALHQSGAPAGEARAPRGPSIPPRSLTDWGSCAANTTAPPCGIPRSSSQRNELVRTLYLEHGKSSRARGRGCG